jgi:hypothetical protein
MNMFSFCFLSIDDHLSSTGQTSPRLHDLIAGLRSGDIAAAPILSRLDPNLSDEIRALVAHRGVTVESFLANVLMAFALDVADETWRRVTGGGESVVDDAEAGVLGDLIAEAMRQILLHGLRIEGETATQECPRNPAGGLQGPHRGSLAPGGLSQMS